MAKARRYSPLQVNLTSGDQNRLAQLAQSRSITKGALAREAILFYLDNHERLATESRERELVKTVRGCFERTIAILARQGTEIGTLYELAWRNHVEANMEESFIAAVGATKQRLRRQITDDERTLTAKMKNAIVPAQPTPLLPPPATHRRGLNGPVRVPNCAQSGMVGTAIPSSAWVE